jgi:hypothetical protein
VWSDPRKLPPAGGLAAWRVYQQKSWLEKARDAANISIDFISQSVQSSATKIIRSDCCPSASNLTDRRIVTHGNS